MERKGLKEKEWPEEDEGNREEDEGGKSIGVDNKDKVIHSSGHSCFAECGQPDVKALHHHHSCNWHHSWQPCLHPHLSLSLSKIHNPLMSTTQSEEDWRAQSRDVTSILCSFCIKP